MSLQQAEKECERLKEELGVVVREKKKLEGVAGDTESLKTQVTELTAQVFQISRCSILRKFHNI